MFSAFGRGSPSLGPDDISMMQALVKNYCLTKAIDLDSEEAWDAARELLKWFQIGVTDKSRLQELLASRT
ncbi:acetyltransferase [Rhizobium sp. SIMBA_035]